VPSSPVLLSAPGRRPPSRRLPSGAAAGLQRSGIVAVIDTARTPPRRRSWCPACGVHPAGSSSEIRLSSRPVSGPSGVRSPASVVRGPPIRPVAVDPSSVQPLLSTRPVSSRLLSTPSVRSRPSPPNLRRWRGNQVEAAGQPLPQQPVEVPVAAATSGGWGRQPRSPGDRRRCRGRAVVSRVSVADPAGSEMGSGGRPCPLRDQAGQAGVRSRLWLAVAPWAGSRPRRELAAAAAWLCLRAGWATTLCGGRGGGPSGWPPARGAGGDGVRPQRGPGWQRAFPAGCRQRCDLREWVVGLPGLEPGTSSLSAIFK
jgi:hypothetical protein